MNKELIKKYLKEFTHWVNGGKLQAYYKDDTHPKWWTEEDSMEDSNQSIMEHILTHNTDTSKVIVVIDDAYIEYRKALAEGKTIQYCPNNSLEDWKDLNSKAEIIFRWPLENYRIKPKEPQFKVGDWVRTKNGVTYIIETCEGLKANNATNLLDCEPWKPQPGEWCWFYNDSDKAPILAKFIKMSYKSGWTGTPLRELKGMYYKADKFKSTIGWGRPTDEDYTFFYCEPFIGQLPTNLKTHLKTKE